MGLIQTTNKHNQLSSSDNTRRKRIDRFRTIIRSITFRALTSRSYQNSISSSNTTTTTSKSHSSTEPYLNDFDYQKLAILTGLTEIKINYLHQEFVNLTYDGRLSYEQYKSMLQTIPFYQTKVQLEQLARQTFTLFDKDGNNYLDFAEFIAAYITMENK